MQFERSWYSFRLRWKCCSDKCGWNRGDKIKALIGSWKGENCRFFPISLVQILCYFLQQENRNCPKQQFFGLSSLRSFFMLYTHGGNLGDMKRSLNYPWESFLKSWAQNPLSSLAVTKVEGIEQNMSRLWYHTRSKFCSCCSSTARTRFTRQFEFSAALGFPICYDEIRIRLAPCAPAKNAAV